MSFFHISTSASKPVLTPGSNMPIQSCTAVGLMMGRLARDITQSRVLDSFFANCPVGSFWPLPTVSAKVQSKHLITVWVMEGIQTVQLRALSGLRISFVCLRPQSSTGLIPSGPWVTPLLDWLWKLELRIQTNVSVLPICRHLDVKWPGFKQTQHLFTWSKLYVASCLSAFDWMSLKFFLKWLVSGSAWALHCWCSKPGFQNLKRPQNLIILRHFGYTRLSILNMGLQSCWGISQL